MVAERGKEELFNAKLCRSVLADLTRNKFKTEQNLLLRAIESGSAKIINGATESDLQICKVREIKKLTDDYSINPSSAEWVVNMLAEILRGDCNPTIISPPPKPDDHPTPQLREPQPQTGRIYISAKILANDTAFANYTQKQIEAGLIRVESRLCKPEPDGFGFSFDSTRKEFYTDDPAKFAHVKILTLYVTQKEIKKPGQSINWNEWRQRQPQSQRFCHPKPRLIPWLKRPGNWLWINIRFIPWIAAIFSFTTKWLEKNLFLGLF